MFKIMVCVIAMLFMEGLAWAAPLRVVTTTEDLAAIAREVGGARVTVESLARGSQDPHFLEARPSLILRAAQADLFIQVGLDLEVGWAPLLLVEARNPAILPGAPGYLDASTNIEVLEVPTTRVDRSLGDVHPFGNPHYTLDPENGKVIAHDIAQRLMAMLPGQADVIEHNHHEFVRRLDRAISQWKEQMKPYQEINVVTYHKSWTYFARRFGLSVVGYVEPKPGIPPSPAHIAQLIPLMKQQKVRLIVMEPFYARAIADGLAQHTGAKLLVLPSSVGGADNVKTYVDLFDHLVGQLTKALSEGR